MEKIFRDPEVSERLIEDGFVVIEDLAGPAVSELHPELLSHARSGGFGGLWSSARDADLHERLTWDRRVRAVLEPVLAQLATHATTFLAGVIEKSAHAPALPLHQDLSYVDERRHRSYTCWVPLSEVDDHNGALRAVRGSHRWTRGVRAIGPCGAAYPTELEAELAPMEETLPLAPGSLVIWDNAVLHGSTPNSSDEPRTVVASTFASADVDLQVWWSDAPGRLEGYVLDDGFLAQDRPFLTRPTGQRLGHRWGEPQSADSLRRDVEQALSEGRATT